ncbi:sensor histidine kinase [Litoribrevibacter euphylliae]|uniref:histidine kinase n=1 Tax=Litoribrevibacter euphylliae TaxID=1834034 RepID=A0ABV7HHD3_9GAMM
MPQGLWLPNRRLIEVYNYYRLLLSLSLALAMSAVLGTQAEILQTFKLYQTVSYSYLFVALILTAVLMVLRQVRIGHIIITISIDIAFLTVLMYAAGGIHSGLGNLIIIAVACGNIITTGRFGALLAAIATIGTLYMEFYLQLEHNTASSGYVRAGLQGLMYFGTSILIQNITKRIDEGELLAKEQAREIINLEHLNKMIIQRMRTGIIVCSENGRVHLVNEAAKALMPVDNTQEAPHTDFKSLPPLIRQYLSDWKSGLQHQFATFSSIGGHAEVRCSFARLTATSDEILIFLEDASKLKREAQQLKLASLGRLTASIAHEIRNPLGAISHASQLLQESHNLDTADSKLASIIQNHCLRVNRIIENVLQLSRQKVASTDRIELSLWLPNLVETITQSNMESDITLDLKEEITAQFVDSQLEQVVTNLITNGLRYSKYNTGKATVELRTDIDDKTGLPYLDVIDNGQGISESEPDKVFEPFYTTDSAGTGLGLFISKELCELNQANLDYSKHPEKGSQFRITFAHPDKII